MPELTRDRPEAPALRVADPPSVRPVMLLTFDVPFDRAAAAFAVESAAEAGAELYVCDGVPVGPSAVGSLELLAHREAAARERALLDLDRRVAFQPLSLASLTPRLENAGSP